MNMFAMDHSLQLGKCESFCTISCSILKQLRPVFTEVACVCITYIMSYTVVNWLTSSKCPHTSQ